METLPLYILIAAYAAHIMEEYFLNWKDWAEKLSGLAMNWTEFLLANGAVIILGFCCANVGFSCPMFSYLFVGLAMSNALFAHIGTSIVKRTFSPGLLTSVFLFLPLSIWAYEVAIQKGIFSLPFLLFTILGGMIIMLYPVMLQLLKKHFKNKGTLL